MDSYPQLLSAEMTWSLSPDQEQRKMVRDRILENDVENDVIMLFLSGFSRTMGLEVLKVVSLCFDWGASGHC